MMETIAKRQSCRKYKEEQISDQELEIIVQAANASPVSMGDFKDVKLTVIQNKELIQKLEANAYNIMAGIGAQATYGAPTIIVINGKKEEGMKAGIPYCNASCVAENIMLAATELGLGSVYLLAVPLTMQYNLELCKEAMVPEGYAPMVVVAVGKPVEELKPRELTTDKFKIDYIK